MAVDNNKEKTLRITQRPLARATGDTTPSSSDSTSDEADKTLEALGYTPVGSHHHFPSRILTQYRSSNGSSQHGPASALP